MKYKSLILLITLFTSCVSVKWKKNYINKNIGSAFRKYHVSEDYLIQAKPGELITKPFEKLTRRDVKKNVVAYEKIIAIVPDSTYESNDKTDSFYWDKNKIEFIKIGKLKTSFIHFIEK